MAPWIVRARVKISDLEPWVLVDNPNYNPDFRIGRFSGYRSSWAWAPESIVTRLAEDLKANGQRNPICVWEVSGKLYVVYGASRVKAARLAGLETLDAIVSGHYPDPGFMLGSDVDPSNLEVHFKDPPLHWRIEPEGFLYFDGCVSPFDEVHNPKGAAALKAREGNNGVRALRASVSDQAPQPEQGAPSDPPADASAGAPEAGSGPPASTSGSGTRGDVRVVRGGHGGPNRKRKSV